MEPNQDISKEAERKYDNLDFRFVRRNDGITEAKIAINGFWNTAIRKNLPPSDDRPHRAVRWLEEIVLRKDGTPVELTIGRSDYDERDTVFSIQQPPAITPAQDDNGSQSDRRFGMFVIHECWHDKMRFEVLCDTDNFVRRFYNCMRRDLKDTDNIHSEVIESYFISKPSFRLDYRGYFAIMTPNKNDLRYAGVFYDKDHPEKAIDGYGIFADDADDARPYFESTVNKIIERKEWDNKSRQWEASGVDRESIGCVFDILPERFKERIESGAFDKHLLEAVPGGDYEVPLYYVTKAWDVLLKGKLDIYAFMIGPEEDERGEDYEEALREFMAEEGATRTRPQAIEDNDKMKAVWKDLLGIDVDAVDVDFAKFNMHLPPNVSEDESDYYFEDVPDGVFEWILDGINNPNGTSTFDSVSALMEFAAFILRHQALGLWL